MRLALFGATRISVECFRTARRMGIELAGVVTTPREFAISYAPSVSLVQHADLVAEARAASVPVIVMKGKLKEYTEQIRELDPEFILAVGWYHVIPSAIREIPRLGCAGVHASLLPRYRGGAPINWALINGEERTGVTLFYLDGGVDTGDIIAQAETPIGFEDTCATLYDRVIVETRRLLETCLPLVEQGRVPRISQDERQATAYPQRRPEDGLISWSTTTRQLYNWVRAQTRPYPGAFTFLDGRRVMVWKASMLEVKTDVQPGTVLAVDPSRSLDVATLDGAMRLLELTECPWDLVHPGSRFSEGLARRDSGVMDLRT